MALADEIYVYDEEIDEESIQSFGEFQLASAIYYAQLEGAASEQAARVQAMENASSCACSTNRPVALT